MGTGTTHTAALKTIPVAAATTLPARYKWELLLLLWIAFFLNQADRQIFSVVLPLIKKELSLSDGELGLIASMLVWTYGCLVPVAGFIGDRWPRKSIIAGSLFFWSLATLATGFCSTLLQFILLRGVATGGGEAFYAPSANALLSEHHTKSRSLSLSLHQTAVYAGIILSGLIAGYIAERFGWRYAFFSFGSFGVLIAVIISFRLKKDSPPPAALRPNVWKTAAVVFRKPTVLFLTAAFACMVFVNVGYLTWMPSFLIDKFNLSITQAGFHSMLYHHAGAFLGVLAGGRISDRLVMKKRYYRLIVQAAGLLFGAPFIYLMAVSGDLTGVYFALFFFGIFRGVYDSNIFASLYEVVEPSIRSSASGLMLMCAFLAGAFAPWLLGMLKPSLGLGNGLALLSVFYVAGSMLIIIAAYRYFNKDKIQAA